MRNFKNKRFGGLPSRLFFVAVAFAADRFSSPYVAAAQQNLYNGFAETAFGRQCRLHAFLWDKRLEALADTPRRSRRKRRFASFCLWYGSLRQSILKQRSARRLRQDNYDVPRRALFEELPVLRGRAACGDCTRSTHAHFKQTKGFVPCRQKGLRKESDEVLLLLFVRINNIIYNMRSRKPWRQACFALRAFYAKGGLCRTPKAQDKRKNFMKKGLPTG